MGNNVAKVARKNNFAKRQEYLFVASVLIVPIIFFLVFWVYVNIDSFALVFWRKETVDGAVRKVFTFRNFELVYEKFLKNGELLIATRNTLLFYAVALVIVLPISILMAYFVYKKILCFRFFRTITYLPNIICSSALVVLYKYTFMAGGPISAIAQKLGNEYSSPLGTDKAIIYLLIYNVIFGFGANMVVFGGAMNSVSEDVLEAGKIDGCNWFQELVKLIIPMIWPTISTILVLSFAGILSSTGPILAMTGGDNNTATLSFLLYGYATGAVKNISQDLNLAATIGLVMTLVTFPIVLIIKNFLYKDEKEG